jgi:hypothetical protein
MMVQFKQNVQVRRGKRGRLARGAEPVPLVSDAVACGDVEALVRALCDGRMRVSRAACKALARGFFVPRERLFELFVKDRREHVRVQVVRLLARGQRVRSMVSLLWACTLARSGRVHDAAVSGLRRWGTIWPDFPLGEVFELAAALCSAEGALPADLADALWRYVSFRTGLERRRCLEIVDPELARRDAEDGRPGVARAELLQTSWAARVVRSRYELAPRPFARLRALWPRPRGR